MKKECVLYTQNEHYGKRLIQVLSQKAKLQFDVKLYTDREGMEQYLTQNKPTVLIVDDSSYYEGFSAMHSGKSVILSEEQMTDSETEQLYGEDVITVYKYQDVDRLYDAIAGGTGLVHPRGKLRAKIAALYSPVYSDSRTAFALTLAAVLAEKHKVLYVNTEEFSGLDSILWQQNEGSLSDALYYYRQEADLAYEKISGTISKTAGLHYIPPVKCAEDMSCIHPQELMGLLNCIANNKDMELIILDLSNTVDVSWKVLEYCDCIYMPVKDDYLSEKKLQQFENYYYSVEKEDTFERIMKLHLPEGEETLTDDFWDRVSHTGMYRFVKKLAEQLEGSIFDG